LDRTKKLLSLSGNPDEKYYIIHVAGTNGKGSTSAMLEQALLSSGLKTGLYTSPHLHSYRERIRINNKLISEENFAEETEKLRLLIEKNKDLFEENPTEFEFLTIMAANYFAREKVDVVIFETGLGGRLDSTNALRTNLSIISNIGIDHKEILGETIELIAGEKAGIIHSKGQVVVGIQENAQGKKVILEKIEKEKANYYDAEDISYKILPEKDGLQKIYVEELETEVLLNLQGEHQIDNMLSVISALKFLKKDLPVKISDFLKGLSKVNWPGRLELLKYQGREVLIDGAHNPQGARKLKKYLDSKYAGRKIYFLLGILDDKDKEGILKEVYENAVEIVFSKPEGSRNSEWNKLPSKFKYKENIIFIENTQEALLKLVHMTTKEDLILSFGSFYFISKVREIINSPI